jgi:DNA-binding GntR family transcriptional regulator
MDTQSKAPLMHPQETLEQYAARRLRAALLVGTLAPGQRLKPDVLAEWLGCSRSPVRTAISQLASEGLVRIVPRRGAFAAQMSRAEVAEAYAIRAGLEGRAAAAAARNMDMQTGEVLAKTLEGMKRRADIDAWLDGNRLFHDTLCGQSGFPVMCTLVRYLRNVSEPYTRVYLESKDSRSRSEREHAELLKACMAGEPALAGKLARAHLMGVRHAVLHAPKVNRDES